MRELASEMSSDRIKPEMMNWRRLSGDIHKIHLLVLEELESHLTQLRDLLPGLN